MNGQPSSDAIPLQRALEEAAERYAALLDTTSDGVLVIDTNGRVLEANAAYCRQSGYSASELVGMGMWQLDTAEDEAATLERASSIIAAGSLVFEAEQRRKDGTTWPVEVSVSYSPIQGGRLFSFLRDITERRENRARVEHMAYHDVLTGLPNRELLADRLRQACRAARRTGSNLGVAYVDIDGFKPVNDQYGHDVGDELLIQLAGRMLEQLRDGDTVARLGGDEFVVLLNGVQGAFSAEEAIERLLQVLSEPLNVGGRRVQVTASIGMTLFPEDDVDADTLLRHADQAMYRAKEEGKGVIRLFDPVEQQRVSRRREQLLAVENALQSEELCLFFQPRIDLRSGRVVGAEALVRWQHPKRGLLPPSEILPPIQGTPLEIALDEWVLQHALDQHMRLRERGLQLPVSVNISPQSIQRASFTGFLDRLLSRYPPDVAEQLEIEILETAAIGNTEKVAETMDACAELGVRFSLDDFGTGYSSLTYFHRLPIGILKIDQHFVRNLLSDAQDHDIVEGVLLLAKALGRPVVAEGVESIEIALLLYQLGCQYAQGYGIARPMPAEDLAFWVANWEQGSFCDDLREFSDGPLDDYDLKTALFAHERWMQRLRRYVDSGCSIEPPAVDALHCKFGAWCEGVGRQRFAERPFFHRVLHAHAAVHRAAQELLKAAREGVDHHALVQERMREIETESYQLETLLAALDKNIA